MRRADAPARGRSPAIDAGAGPQPLGRSAEVGLALFGVLTLVLTVAVGIVHIDDRFLLNPTSGVWMGLAQAAHDGLLYPPLFDGEHYGGTRYMPVPILLHAGLAALTGEYLVSGKLLSLAVSGLLALLLFVALGRSALGKGQRLALAAMVWITDPGATAAFNIHNDALPVVLQLAALVLVDRCRGDWRVLVAAGLLCALAMLSKLTSAWAPAAIGCYLLIKDPRALLVFVPATLVPLGLGIVGLNALSGGRMFESLFTLALTSDGLLGRIFGNLNRFVDDLHKRVFATWTILPIALLAVVASVWRRELRLYHLALGFATVAILFAYSDIGVRSNHMIDISVLAAVVIAGAAAGVGRPMRVVVGAIVLWWAATTVVFDKTVYTYAKQALVDGERYPRDPLGALLAPEHSLLSADSFVPVERGRRPVVLDFYMYRRLAEVRPELAASLLRRVRTRDFDRIVSNIDIARTPRDSVNRTHNFGQPIWEAILDNYTLIATVGAPGTYFVYAPMGP